MLQREHWQELCCSVDAIRKIFGTPAYVYNMELLSERVHQLRSLFSCSFSISYAVKANPNRYLLKALSKQIDCFDVSSAGELHRVLAAGAGAGSVSFSGPAKRLSELKSAIELGVGDIVIESLDEARSVNRLCQQLNKKQRVLIRITPLLTPKNFGASMANKSSQFGIDEEQLPSLWPEINRLSALDICGFHIYSGSNCLSADSIIENFSLMLDCFSYAREVTGVIPKKLIFGAGFGLPYLQSEDDLDIHAVSAGISPLISEYLNKVPGCRMVLELGRWLVGPVGLLLTSVISSKTSRGRQIRLCDAGFNNHLAAFGLMGSVIRRNWRIHNLSNPLAETEMYNLVGPLCTSIDVLAQNIKLPVVRNEDVLAIENSGAYGLTASPVGFISHPMPAEIALLPDQLLDISEPLIPCISTSSPSLIDSEHSDV